MPGWHEATKALQESGQIQVVGIIQEQHPDRCALFMQWKEMDWPIMVDSLDLLGVSAVPITVLIDEAGVVHKVRARTRDLEAFLSEPPVEFEEAATPQAPNLDKLRAHVSSEDSSDLRDPANLNALRYFIDSVFLWGGPQRLDEAILIYQSTLAMHDDATFAFHLGVALQSRYEKSHEPDDFARAIKAWSHALASDPNQYIWRRRIQQYGPRLDKPYNFYFWVEQARKEIKARGETPVRLAVEPAGSELAPPAKGRGADGDRSAASVATSAPSCRETNESLQRDDRSYVAIESIVTPARVRPGQRVRVRVGFQLNPKTRPYWNNEARELAVCLDPPPGLSLGEGSLVFPNPSKAETQEDRAVEFEVTIADEAQPGVVSIPAYALYYVCENKGGKCRYLRKDFAISIEIDPTAPTLR
ncbi:MAG: hypothetical protein IIC02_00955 [Planctomycetes bacterium]|nr:hypothetical protein [Planctomycetota bacterium]